MDSHMNIYIYTYILVIIFSIGVRYMDKINALRAKSKLKEVTNTDPTHSYRPVRLLFYFIHRNIYLNNHSSE